MDRAPAGPTGGLVAGHPLPRLALAPVGERPQLQPQPMTQPSRCEPLRRPLLHPRLPAQLTAAGSSPAVRSKTWLQPRAPRRTRHHPRHHVDQNSQCLCADFPCAWRCTAPSQPSLSGGIPFALQTGDPLWAQTVGQAMSHVAREWQLGFHPRAVPRFGGMDTPP